MEDREDWTVFSPLSIYSKNWGICLTSNGGPATVRIFDSISGGYKKWSNWQHYSILKNRHKELLHLPSFLSCHAAANMRHYICLFYRKTKVRSQLELGMTTHSKLTDSPKNHLDSTILIWVSIYRCSTHSRLYFTGTAYHTYACIDSLWINYETNLYQD